jgi:hypothetical protein
VVGELLASWQVGGARADWRPFLHHISKSEPNNAGDRVEGAEEAASGADAR